mmetsp:Transcript_64472/g.179365  ORF Transcript_64472/g.179365 Transcript_64472/m.179365 type:complete len:624 (-) Transcript_64472:190-2061(-)
MPAFSALRRLIPSASGLAGLPTPLRAPSVGPSTCDGQQGACDEARGPCLQGLVAAIASPETEAGPLLAALTELRNLLSTQMSPPIQVVVDLGGAEALIRKLVDGSSPAVQLEAAWALTNLACGTTAQTTRLVDAGVVEAFFTALQSPAIVERPELCEQCLWALGNIAGEGAWHRDNLLAAGVLGVLSRLFSQMPSFPWPTPLRAQVLRTLTWLMSSLCRGDPAPDFEEVDCAFDYFAQVLAGSDDVHMLSEALWGLCYLIEGAGSDEANQSARGIQMLSVCYAPDEVPQSPAKHPLVARVVECTHLTGSPCGTLGTPTFVPALRLLGQMVSTSNPALVDAALSAGAPKAFRRAMQDRRMPKQVRRDAAWAIANIAAGTREQVQLLLDADVWDALARELQDGPLEVGYECAWAVANLVKGGPLAVSQIDGTQALWLVSRALHSEADEALQRALLDAAEAILAECSGSQLRTANHMTFANKNLPHPLATAAQESGFLEALEELQLSERDNIYKQAARLLESWFAVEKVPAKEQAVLANARAILNTRASSREASMPSVSSAAKALPASLMKSPRPAPVCSGSPAKSARSSSKRDVSGSPAVPARPAQLSPSAKPTRPPVGANKCGA